MRVEEFLRRSAARHPAKTALVTSGRRLTYRDLDAASDALAATLVEHGVGRGDRVVVFMDNGWQAVTAIFAALKAGAVFCPVHPTTKAAKLAFLLGHCRASAIITQDRLAPVAMPAIDQAASVELAVVADRAGPRAVREEETLKRTVRRLRFDDAIADPRREAPDSPGIGLDLAMIIYTSGSTGAPKGVMMTHDNIVAAATSITTYLASSADDVIVSALPLSFDYGLYQALMAVKTGATLVLEKSFAFPRAILDRLAAEQATVLPLVPTMAAMLLEMRDLEPGRLPHLRTITNTAAALPPAHIERLQRLFPQASIYSMYGLTECKRCTYLPPSELARRPASVGIAIPGTEAYVVNEAGERCRPGEVGELVVRGPHIMKGYWEDPEATDRVLRPGPYPWERVLHTGDLFRADDEGFLYFVGRKDDMIKSRGEKVSPREVEAVLYGLPGVREAAVVGVPHPILGMAIKAVIAAAPGAGLTAAAVIRHCAGRLEDFMVPQMIEFRAELPKTETGKINRRLAALAIPEAVAE